MTGGQLRAPLVVRGVNGGGVGFGAQHSQAVENWAMTVPGIKIVSPSNAADMKGLLAAAVRDDDPVLVFEHKRLLGTRGEVPDGELVLPLGQAATLRSGGDATVVALGGTVPLCLQAADELAAQDIEVTVVDLRCLVPLDARTVLASVATTGRLVLVEENPGQLGWASGVAAIVAEEGFDRLRAPIVRVSAANTPLASAKALEADQLPGTADVVAAVTKLT
jgi:pyruvate dehydrogenase E1 component beta subunit